MSSNDRAISFAARAERGDAVAMSTPIADWLFTMMVAAAPLERAERIEPFPGWAETAAERGERYAAIAADLEAVVYDPEVKPIFRGPRGRAKTAALIMAVAFHESGFARDVDFGPCYRGKSGDGTRCDSGRAACLMQVHADHGKTPDGWTLQELFEDRKKCFRAGLRLLRSSFGQCRANAYEHRLAAFASGRCDRGLTESAALIRLGDEFATVSPVPGDDAAFVRAR